MRISDWSSDVCSSDLGRRCPYLHLSRRRGVHGRPEPVEPRHGSCGRSVLCDPEQMAGPDVVPVVQIGMAGHHPGEPNEARSEEHTSELQSLMRISYAVVCLKKKHMIHRQS